MTSQKVMKRHVAKFLVAAVTFLFGLVLHMSLQTPVAQTEWRGHTRPDKWKEPRLFHTPYGKGKASEDRIFIAHEEFADDFKLKVYSPNKAYWYGVNPDSREERPSRQSESRFHVFSPDASIYVFNERERLIKIVLKDHYPNFVLDVRWINEKLLYIEVWWGRVLGSYYIFDVEKELVIHKEVINDGTIAFMQWEQSKKE